MKRKKIIYTLIAGFSAISINSFSQQGTSICSNASNINGLKFDYTIGEMTLVTTQKNAELIITQGLLQPDNFKKGIPGPADNTNILQYNNIKVYPNPAKNILHIEFTENEDTKMSYQLFDATGNILLSETYAHKSGTGNISLHMENYAAGNYYLTIMKSNTQEKLNYKLQKIN